LAGTSEPDRVYCDAPANCDVVDAIADGYDFAGDLVACRHGVGVGAIGVHEQVGAADADGSDADQGLAGSGDWCWNLCDFHGSGTVV
jgi:hypothetical protein